MTTTIVVIIISLLFSALFSGMEIAFLSSNRLQIEIEKKQGSFVYRVIDIYLSNPSEFLSTILIGNSAAVVIFSMAMSTFLHSTLGTSNYIVITLISTVVVIFTAEFIPKAVFRASPNFYLKAFALPLFVLYVLFYPLSKLSVFISRILLGIFGVKLKEGVANNVFGKVDLQSLISMSDAQNKVEEQAENSNEIKMLQNAIEFSEGKVRECMVPRIDIQAIDIEATVEELRAMFVDTQYSRILVYQETIDKIVGYANSRELFNSPKSVREMLREPVYVPESFSVQKLLSIFISKHKSLAVVIDEFGATAGMVTIEDILEEIFGEIEDEHDEIEEIEKVLPNGNYIFSGRLEVDYLNQKYNLRIEESNEYETLAGYILYENENIPSEGEIIQTESFLIKILKVESSQIKIVELQTKY